MNAVATASARGWLGVTEVGSVLGMRILLFVALRLGRRAGHVLLRVIVAYFVLVSPRIRRVSGDYLVRMHGRATLRMIYAHVLRFGEVALDRVFFLSGHYEDLEIRTHGHEHLERLARERRGAILLGAHLGSFEAMRARSRDENLVINVLVDFRNAKRVNGVLSALGDDGRTRAIAVDSGSVSFVLALREAIERGEMVAILADRVSERERAIEVSFLGGRARLPLGPFLLASMLGCPIYLTFGLYHAPGRYDLYCEPFAERLIAPRKDRERALAGAAQEFADRLEHYVRLAPDNWFNFFDFWSGT